MTPSFETYIERIEAVLESTPIVYEFGAEQTNDERIATIRALPPHAVDAVLDILINIMLELYDLDVSQKNLEYILGVRDWDCDDIGVDEIRGYSEDWRLRVFENGGDVFYDFNGWPEDVESGAGVFYPAEDPDIPIDVFANSGEDLVSAAGEFDDVVADYAASRCDILMDAGVPTLP